MNIYSKIAVSYIFIISLAGAAIGQSINKADFKKYPINIEADNLNFDEKKSLVTATGNVTARQKNNIITAEKVLYDQKNNIATATGDIELKTEDIRLTADKIILQDDFDNAVIDNITAQFSDESLAYAGQAIKVGDNKIILNDASYTPCPVCGPDKKKIEPLWEIAAKKTSINHEKKKMSYRHAFLNIKGHPVLYTPYFSHSLPGSDRKTGFLRPKYTRNTILGYSVSLPYYINIAPDKDLTVTPIITSEEGTILDTEYRQLFQTGDIVGKTSATYPKAVGPKGEIKENRELRYNVDLVGQFKPKDDWSAGFDIKKASDDTYLRKYKNIYEDTLTSRLFTSYIDKKNYVSAEVISFQGLQNHDDSDKIPVILPHIQYEYNLKSDPIYGNFSVDGDILSLTRKEGDNTHRIANSFKWNKTYYTDKGHVFDIINSIRGDLFLVQEENLLTGRNNTYSAGRVIPQGEVKWSYPLIQNRANYRLFLEPIVSVIVSPDNHNSSKFPNEDSQDVEFSDINLFHSNHFASYDLLEEGPRANYGIRSAIDHNKFGFFNIMIGQSYRYKDNANFTTESGLDEKNSDIVGRLAYKFNNKFDIAYQFRANETDFDLRRNILHVNLDYDIVNFSADYLSIDEAFDNGIDNNFNRELVVGTADIKFNEQWSLFFTGNRDLVEASWRLASGGIKYSSDCVDFTLSGGRDFIRDRDVEPNSSISFQITLRNLTD